MNPFEAKPSVSVKEIDLFSHLSDKQLEAIERFSIIKHYGEEEIVFYEGEESQYFHFLMQGEITIIKTSTVSETIAVHRFHAPSLIAEMATLKNIPYPASAKCAKKSVVLKIKRGPFLEFLSEDPSLSITLISSLISKISALELSLQRHSAPNAMSKVARLLRDEPETFAKLKGIDIAHLIGISPETLSRMIKKLKDENVIVSVRSRGYTISDPVKLNMLADNNYPLRE